MLNAIQLLKLLNEETESSLKTAKEILEREIKLSDRKPLSSKQRETKVASHFKKIAKGARPILGKCVYQDGFQVFTDSYVGFKLVADDHLSLLPEASKEESYPNVVGIIDSIRQDTRFAISLQELQTKMNLAKADKDNVNKVVELDVTPTRKAYFKINLMELFIVTMNFEKDEELEFYFTETSYDDGVLKRPLKLTKTNGSTGIILPLLRK